MSSKRKVERIINCMEKDRINILGFFLIIMALGFLRALLEDVIVYDKITADSVARYTAMMFTQLSVFLGGTLIASYFSKEGIRKVMNATILIMWMVILPPFLDMFVFNANPEFEYFATELLGPEGPFEVITAGIYTGHSLGIIAMGLLMSFLLCFYIFFKTRSVFRAVCGVFMFYIFALFFAGQSYNSITLMLRFWVGGGMRPLIFSLIFCFLIMYKEDKKLAWGLLKSTKHLKNLYFIILVAAGMVLGGNYGHIVAFMHDTIIRILMITFIWQFTVVVNNIFDEEIDRVQGNETPVTSGIISRRTYLDMGAIFALLAVLMSLLTNNLVFTAATAMGILSAVLYSVPPLRLRKYIFSTWFIGLGSVIAFLIGYFRTYSWPFVVEASPSLTPDVILLLVILFSAVTIGTGIKDIKDVEGDRKAGVRTVFTVFGAERGKLIVSVLLFLSLLMPILLFNRPFDVVFFLALALTGVVAFKRLEVQEPVIFLSMIVFVYCVARLVGFF